MYDYGWRNYDPAISRWVNIDPLFNDLKFTFDDSQVDEDDEEEVYEAIITKLETGDGVYNVDNLNPYGYGYNNPVSFDDPDGRCPVCVVVLAALLYSEFANAPTKDTKLDARNYNNAKPLRTIASETVLKRGNNLLVTPGKVNATTGIKPQKQKKAETLAKNKETGKKFEEKVGQDLKKDGHRNIQDQVTIKPNGGGKKVRIDKVSKNKEGKTVLTEAKSSKTATLTKNQKSGFPAIEQNGGTIVGQGKPGYPGGTVIPPTKVNVVRPKEK